MSTTKNSIKQIYDYLKRTSRPDTVQGLINNLENCKKGDITNALDNLVEEDKVKEKINGKSKIYYLNQKELKKTKSDNIGELDQILLEKKELLKSIENSIKEKETELAAFDGKLTKAELKIEHDKQLKKLDDLNKELENLTNAKMNKENKSKKYDYELVSKECRKRRRITREIIDGLEEFTSKSKKALLEEIGIEFYK